MARFEKFVTARPTTHPIKSVACASCGYKARCEAEWRSSDSLYFVAGITTTQAENLAQFGVTTLPDLAKCEEASVPGIRPAALSNLVAQARLQVTAHDAGEHKVEHLALETGRGFHILPPPSVDDLYFDLEGDPFLEEGLEYLFGVWRGKSGSQNLYTAHWAHDTIEEKRAFETVVDLLADHVRQHPGAHIYHFTQYEPNASLTPRHEARRQRKRIWMICCGRIASSIYTELCVRALERLLKVILSRTCARFTGPSALTTWLPARMRSSSMKNGD